MSMRSGDRLWCFREQCPNQTRAPTEAAATAPGMTKLQHLQLRVAGRKSVAFARNSKLLKYFVSCSNMNEHEVKRSEKGNVVCTDDVSR